MMKLEWSVILVIGLDIVMQMRLADLTTLPTKTQCGNITCSGYAKCRGVTDGSGGYECICFAGYTGNTCSEDIDECAFGGSALCFYRGYCFNTIGSFRCECLTGWEGPEHCETPTAPAENRKCVPGHIGEWCLDTCLNNSMCGQNQECEQRGKGLRCICIRGWHGSNCTEDIDECVSNPCNNTEICVNTPGSYHCKNIQVTTTPDISITNCDALNCSKNSKCLDDGYGNKFCRCFVGFKGANCYEDVDECMLGDKACLFRGSCHNTYGSWWCECLHGWQNTGQCETPKSPPENRTCTPLYMGEWCKDQCLSNDMCGFHQECKMHDEGLRCICYNGWVGVNCSQDIDECLNNPCSSTEICVNTAGSYHCTVDSISTVDGLNTSLCTTLNCSENSACVDDFYGGKMCHCFAGFKGVQCNDDIDECSFGNKICYNRGVCHNTYGSWWCDCLQGWNGTYCQNPVEHTENRRCVEGHFGDWCLDTCLNNSMCAKNEECVQEGQGLSCKCISGFHGLTCSEGNDECSYHPCMNNGTCLNNLGSYHCACPQGWQGSICSSDIDECACNPCMNGGRCFNEPGSYHCACGSGWQGATCEYDVDECIMNPCQHNGTCYNKMGSFVCSCNHGWWGETCTHESYECLGPTCILG